MKEILIALAFAIFSLSMPLLMAQAQTQEPAAETEEQTSGDDSAGAAIQLELEGLTPEQELRVKEAIERVSGLLGDKLSTEVKVELNTLKDLAKDEAFEGNIHIGGDGIGFGEALVAITAICLTLGLPVIILLVVFIFAQKKRRQMMELAGMYIKADQPMPEHVLAEFGSSVGSDKRLRTGIQFLLVGAAIMAVLGALADDGSVAVLGLIPVAIGLARIIYWRYESKKPVDNHPELPGLSD